MRRIAASIVVAAALAGFAAGPVSAQSLTVCTEARVTVAGNAVVDEPYSCTTLPQ